MQELSFEQVEDVSGGLHPFWHGVGIASGYLSIIDYSMDFGRGLGLGLYDAIHQEPNQEA